MSFKQRLHIELQKEAPGIARRSRRRRSAVKATAGGAALVGVVGVVGIFGTTGGAGSGAGVVRPAAYTITEEGTRITVTFREFRTPDRLEADLAKRGVKANITYLLADKTCQPNRVKPYSIHPGHRPITTQRTPDSFEFDKRRLPANTTLVLVLSQGREKPWFALQEGLTSAPVPPCTPSEWPSMPPPK
jgi:hypothetical protein